MTSPEDRRSTALAATALLLGAGWYLAQRYLPGQASFVVECLLFALASIRLAKLDLLGTPSPDRMLLAVPGALLLLAMLWRDSATLVALDVLALLVLVALGVPDASGRPLVLAGPGTYVERAIRAGAGWVLGAVPLAWSALAAKPRLGRWRGLAAAGIGVAAVSPALLLFAALLSSADPALGRVLESLVAVDLGPVVPHVAGIALASWFAGGLLWAAAREPRDGLVVPAGGRVGATTVFAALGAIELLFLLYVVLQSRYLFGGYAHVLGAEQLSVADYARRGFFELVTVAGLTLPILMFADWALEVRRPADRIGFRWHVLGLVALLFLLLGSALSRMLLYTREFGLTESRVYVTAVMAWLACVFAWFAVVQLRPMRDRFAAGAFAAALQVLLAVNLVNVDGMIVRVNVARAAAGSTLDSRYLTQLGAGAVPQVLRLAERIPVAERCELLRGTVERWERERNAAEPRWNLERQRATGRLLAEVVRRTRSSCSLSASVPLRTPPG